MPLKKSTQFPTQFLTQFLRAHLESGIGIGIWVRGQGPRSGSAVESAVRVRGQGPRSGSAVRVRVFFYIAFPRAPIKNIHCWKSRKSIAGSR